MKGVKSDKWNENLEAVKFDDSVSKKKEHLLEVEKLKEFRYEKIYSKSPMT